MSASLENVPRNPVGRLHRLLSQMPSNNNTVGSWLVSYFGVSNSSVAVQIDLYADLAHLIVESQKTLGTLQGYVPDDLRAFQEPIEKVAAVVSSSNPTRPTYEFKSQVSAETLKGLEFYSRFLTRDAPEVTLAADKMQELLGQVQALSNEIMGADLDAQLKAILLEHLSAVERALRLYAISGSAGLRRAANGLLGAATFGFIEHPDQKSRDWMKQCVNFAALIGWLIGLIANAHTALPQLFSHTPQLPPGP